MRPGISDICILETTVPAKRVAGGLTYYAAYRGMWIELKRQKGGKVTEAQKKWGQNVEMRGYCFYIARGAQDAINKIEEVYGKWPT